MLIVGIDPAVVESDLVAGRLACPSCEGELRPWGHARNRDVRGAGAVVTVRRLRRSICSLGRKTHVLVPEDTLSRRRDTAEVIGSCLLSRAGGASRRSIAIALGRHESTVAGWLRRFRANAVRIREHFWRWAEIIASGHGAFSPSGSAFSDAVEAIGVVGQVAVRRFGPRSPWLLASVLTGGQLLATRAHPYPSPM